MTAAIAFDNLTLGYDRHPAVHHLRGEVARGSLLAVVGPNGAGKSTLLKGIAGVLKPLGGAIHREGGAHGAIAYLPQAAEIDRSFPLSLHEFVAMGGWDRIGFFRRVNSELRRQIAEALGAVGLSGFENRAIGTLSGGQLQRALFARLMLQNAGTILLDEPFTAIDQRTTADLLEIVRRWHGEKRTVVAVLHDLSIVRGVFPQSLLLAREAIAWGPTETALSPANLLAARRMVESFASDAHVCERPGA
jgi:zinc/manganese transport system ATP-binding protein